MRVLVMGGTGLLGSGIARRLATHGHDVTVTSRGKHAAELPAEITAATVDRYDLAAMRDLVGAVRPDVVVDGIAYAGRDGEDDLRLFAGRVGHLIMISSDFAYRPSYQRLPITEDAPLRAGTPYSEGKVDCEEVLRGQDDLPVTVLRPPHVMGQGGRLGSGSMHGRDATLPDRVRRGVPLMRHDTEFALRTPNAAVRRHRSLDPRRCVAPVHARPGVVRASPHVRPEPAAKRRRMVSENRAGGKRCARAARHRSAWRRRALCADDGRTGAARCSRRTRPGSGGGTGRLGGQPEETCLILEPVPGMERLLSTAACSCQL